MKKLIAFLMIFPFILLYGHNSFSNPFTDIEPGIYTVNGLRGGAELIELGGNDYSIKVNLQYGNRNTGFTGSCFARDGDIVCPVVFDDEYHNATYELIIKSAGKDKIMIDMPNGGSTDLCGAGFCVADNERIYVKANDKNKKSKIPTQMKKFNMPTYTSTPPLSRDTKIIDKLGLYGFYIGQSFDDAIKAAQGTDYTVECHNIIQTFDEDGKLIPGDTSHYEKLCTPKNTLNPLKDLKNLVNFNAELEDLELNDEAGYLLNYYVKKLMKNYKKTSPKFFTMNLYSEVDPVIDVFFHSENGDTNYKAISILFRKIDKAISSSILKCITDKYGKFSCLGDIYIIRYGKGVIAYEKNDEGFLNSAFFMGNFDIKQFLESLKREIEDKIVHP